MKTAVENRTLHSLHTIDLDLDQVGVTVRRGTRWTDAHNGEILNLCSCLNSIHHIVGQGKVVGVWVGKFRDIPAREIELEHELSSRMYSGLLSSMRRAYGDQFSEDEEVTILKYVRTK